MGKKQYTIQNVLVVLSMIVFVCMSEHVSAHNFTFSSDLEGWEPGGNWEAEFGDPGMEHSLDLGDGALKMNINMSGAGDWQEIRVMNRTIGDLHEYVQITYEFYIPTDRVTRGTLKPYVVLDPGWAKIELDKVNAMITDLPVETINGTKYFKLAVTTNLSDTLGKTIIYIGFVGANFPYQGPVYLDNIQLVKKEISVEKEGKEQKISLGLGLLNHRGQNLFLSGMNLAWMNFGRDLSMFNEEHFITVLDDIAKAKGNALRWWLHVNGSNSPKYDEDGKVIGLGEHDIQNMKRALDLAYDRGILMVMCLWSFDMLQAQHEVNQEWNKQLVEDPEYTRAYIDNALIPIVRALKGHPGIVVWEICNEPEGMTQEYGWTPVRTKMKYVQQFVNLLAGAIHREDPGAKVTNGSWNLRVLTDVNGMTNYYRDDRLIAAGGDPDGVLDVYQVHFYPQHFDETTSPFHHPASYWQLDKPLIIGEFPAKGIKDIGYGFRPRKAFSHITEVYEFAYEKGYAGALGWTWTAHDGFGGIVDATPGILWLYQKYPESITVDTSGVDKIPRVIKKIEDAKLPINSPDIQEYVNLKDIFVDQEDGTNLTFLITENSSPNVLTPIIQDSGTLMLQVAQEMTGVAHLQIKAIDSAGNYALTKFTVAVLDPNSGNVALLKPITTSSEENIDYQVKFSVDGKEDTRWSTKYADDQWLEIDLLGNFLIHHVILKWETAYGKHYEIQVSENREKWTTVYTEQSGNGDIDDILFNPVPAKYIRIHGIQRGTKWGFSLWECEVYGKRVAE